MKNYLSFIVEENEKAAGHAHIEHISDVGAFDGPNGTKRAMSALQGFHAKADSTRKLDDSMSFHVTKTPDGNVGVKYKGSGAKWYFHDGTEKGIAAAHKEIDADLAHKPYMAEKLKHLVSHVHKVLPDRPGSWQGGYMHDPESRHETDGKVHFRPNTINYSADSDSAEGKKIKKSKLGVAIHTELVHPEGRPVPVLDNSEFKHHPDVHLMGHVIPKSEATLSKDDHEALQHHLKEAHALTHHRDYNHLKGHEVTLRTYMNSTVRENKEPTTQGYSEWLEKHHNNKIDSVKTEKAKSSKIADRDAAFAHVKANKEHFENTFKLHHHLEKATDILANHVSRHSTGGFGHDIDGQESGPEGAVIHGLKIVKRRGGFSEANFRRAEAFKKSRAEANSNG